MNYYNPNIFYPYSSMAFPSSSRLLGGALSRGNFSFSSLLNGAQRTLNFVNQAIPVVKQVTPMMRNAKTMFRVMNEFKKVDSPAPSNHLQMSSKNMQKVQAKAEEHPTHIEAGPTFFIE